MFLIRIWLGLFQAVITLLLLMWIRLRMYLKRMLFRLLLRKRKRMLLLLLLVLLVLMVLMVLLVLISLLFFVEEETPLLQIFVLWIL